MNSFSAALMSEYLSKNQGDIAVTTIALETARAELTEDQEDLILVSSSLTCLASPTGELLTASATRISRKNADHRVCRVTLAQESETSSRKSQIAEGLMVFRTSTAEPAPKPVAAAPKELALSSTAETRRRQIFDAACTVIAKHGFGNASMREIAKEAGLSVPLMYKYIKDKDDILYLITTLSMRDLFSHFDESDFQSGSPGQNLSAAVDKYLDYIEGNRRYINLVYSETRSLSSENRQKVFATEKDLILRWQAILEAGVDRGEFKTMNTELMANLIYFLCTAWSLRHWSIGHIDKKIVHEELKHLILNGLCK